MNTLKPYTRLAIGFSLASTSFGIAGGAAHAETLPRDCRTFEVGEPVSKSAEFALDVAGFSGVTVDGRITDFSEQEQVFNAQKELKSAGLIKSSNRICGYAGDTTRQAAENWHAQNKNVPETIIETGGSSEVTVADCSRYGEYTKPTIISLQEELGVNPDGRFDNKTCQALIEFQDSNGLSQSGRGALGPRTAAKLGIALQRKSEQDFSPAEECPKPNSCVILAKLAIQKLQIVDPSGNVMWEIPIQSGKFSRETRTGKGELGRVEYGPKNNPERASVDFPEAILVNPRGFGNGNQKLHGSYNFNPNAANQPESGSAGCIRLSIPASYILAEMPTGTDVFVTGAKPGTTERYFK